MTDTTYQKFVRRWEEVTEVPPQTLGPLTPYYKLITRRLKVMPWPLLLLGALGIVALLYFLVGPAITRLTTILQRGF